MTSVTIPNSVKSIGECAFDSCDDLTRVTIGNSVYSIGRIAFGYSDNLTTVYCKATTPPYCVNDDPFYNLDKTTKTLYVPSGCKSAYKSAYGWKHFKYIYETSF